MIIYVSYCFLSLSLLGSLQEVVPDWQQAASNILVAVGNKHINDIMEEILSKFQPGVLPHFFVVQTLANLSDSNGTTLFTHTNTKKSKFCPMRQQSVKPVQQHLQWKDCIRKSFNINCGTLRCTLTVYKFALCKDRFHLTLLKTAFL